MTGRKVLVVAVVFALLMATLPVVAIGECYGSETYLEDGSFFCTGAVDFIPTEKSRIVGIKEIGENVQKLEYQYAQWPIPSGNLENGFVREKAMAKVLSEDGEFYLGTTKVEVAINIFPEHVHIVEEVVGFLSAENIIRATIYQGDSFCAKSAYYAHKFFIEGQACVIGTVTFKNGTSCLLYMGNWEKGSCKLHIGFKAGYQQYTGPNQPTCRWDPQHCCWITCGYGTYGYYEYYQYIYETYTVGGYGCYGWSGGKQCR